MLSENILVLTNWSIDDALIEAHVLPYVKIIRKHLSPSKQIWVQTLEPTVHDDKKTQSIRDRLYESKINWIPSKYFKFGLAALITASINITNLFLFCYFNKIKIIHIWCTPVGVTGYLLTLLTGAKLVIDSYEPHAESMVENGTWRRYGIKFGTLFLFEKLMSRRAHVLISLAEGMKDYARIKYGVRSGKFYVKPACVDFNLFNSSKVKNLLMLKHYDLTDKIVMVYAGKLGGIYLDREVFDFARFAYNYFGKCFRFLLLTTHSRREVEEFCLKADLSPNVVISRYVRHSEMPDFMGMADFAITPVKSVSSKKYCSPLKNGEYWALGLPVLITKDISDDSSIIERENIGAIFETLDSQGYTLACQKIVNLLKADRNILRLRIIEIAETYRSFDLADKIYSRIYC